MITKHCVRCGTPFQAKRESAKWCSQRCCWRNWREKNPTERPELKRHCQWCGGLYRTTNKLRRTCSYECRVAMGNARRSTTQHDWRQCAVCGSDFQPQQKRGVGRIYCSRACREKQKYRRTKDNRTEKYRADYNALAEKQNHRCAICGAEEKSRDRWNGRTRRLAIDHCHTTGKVRGLLCTGCNSALGHMQDDPERLRAAADYLERFSE